MHRKRCPVNRTVNERRALRDSLIYISKITVGYAREPTEEQDLTAQRDALASYGVKTDRIYVDHELTVRTRIARDFEKPSLRVEPEIRLSSPS